VLDDLSEIPATIAYRSTLHLDPELLALAGVAALLDRLDRESALRVLRWATDRCLKPPVEPR